ncbi:DUF3027 domain-containing protein [Microbacterium sp. p3-SID338]|uniref:DUF3027 domain-containing protein n=1 Tax=unclassified Microbacterium TaxID=2609290 RepID=UPI000C7FFFD9|nr:MULTISPECIES: DUF3027 domain-containing protein [unclassified Microbacterium]MCT1396478.1 DUF3027 domain-containing protein [Microbacterium sp. p3-SID338]PMC04192.1 DUF3027 domain-containing protein [Microbacterium sp. UMB0228]
MTSKPDADARLVEAHDLALSALREITPAATIGPAAGYIPEEDGSVSLRFENRLPGYPGWYWTVTVARVDGEEPTVLEVELLPGDGALLAPEWVPWAERLAEYRAHQAELAEAAAAGGDDEADTDDEDADGELDDDGIDDDELDEDGSDILHAGDLDGVDIDELDDSEDDASDEDDEAEDNDAEDDEAEDPEDDDADARDADVGDEEE